MATANLIDGVEAPALVPESTDGGSVDTGGGGEENTGGGGGGNWVNIWE